MSEISKNIVSLIVSKEFHKAKMLIHEMMNNKLGILLEEKLLEYAPTLYEGEDTEMLDFKLKRPSQKNNNVQNAYDTAGKKLFPPNTFNDPPDFESMFSSSSEPQVNNDLSARDVINYTKDAAGGAYLAEPAAQILTTPMRALSTTPKALEGAASFVAKTGPAIGDTAAFRGAKALNTASKAAVPAASWAENSLVKTLKYPKLVSKYLGKAFPYLVAADDAHDVYQTTRDDPDWKDKPGTAAATLGVDIAKNILIDAPLFMPLPYAGAYAGGAAIGTGFAAAMNHGLDYLEQRGPSRDGISRVDLQFSLPTYDSKNIVNGFKDAFRSKEDIEKETQTEVDNFKKETESSGRGQTMRDADAEGAKITAQFDADQKKIRNLQF